MKTHVIDNEYFRRQFRKEQPVYTELYKQYRDYVFTIVLRYITVREKAEEITQDVFVKAFSRLDDFRDESRFSTWLYCIAINECQDFIRKKKLEVCSLDDERVFQLVNNQDSGFRSDQTIEQESLVQMLDEVTKKLDSIDARLINLFFKEHCPKEIGVILGIQTKTVRNKLSIVKQRFKVKIKRHIKQELMDIIN